MTDGSAMLGARLRHVRGAGGLELAVHERGDASRPTIVLVHGYPDDHAVWDLVAQRLVADHHVVAYDVRGAGASAVPTHRSGYRMDALVTDLAAVVDATSAGSPVHLVGHDWGSIQGWAAIADPSSAGRIASFTSVSGPSLDHAGRWVRAHLRPGGGRWRDGGRQARRSWYLVAMRTPLAPFAWTHGPLAARWADHLAAVEGAEVDDRWPGPHLGANGSNGVELYRANLFGSGPDRGNGTSDVPVQVIAPIADRFVTPALLDGIEAVAPDLVRRYVAGGHWILRADPSLVARLVAEHVVRSSGPAAPERSAG